MTMRKSLLVLGFTVLSFAPAWASHEASGLAVPPGPGFRGGVVAVSHPLAAEAGARMLRSGGNAMAGDATSARTSYYAETAAVFRPGGVPLQQGQILKQPDLAKTLRLIAKNGPDALYRGEIGAAIVAAQRATANGGKPGLMTTQDLADYHIVIREPIVGEYRGYRIAAMSPPSSGGLTMIQALKMIERYPLGDASAGFGFGRAQTLHVMTEAMRLAFADRAVWTGDEYL